jgi:hypothetical protein
LLPEAPDWPGDTVSRCAEAAFVGRGYPSIWNGYPASANDPEQGYHQSEAVMVHMNLGLLQS